MKKQSPMLSVLVALVLGCAAGVTPTTRSASVRVTSNPEVVRPCEFLGNVTAKAVGGTWATTPGERAQRRLQEETLKLGGDTVYIASDSADARVASVTGEAYRCNAPRN